MPYLLSFFGAAYDVRELTASDQAAYARARRLGGLKLNDGRISAACTVRSVEADLILLHAMLKWATTVKALGGGRWLAQHPLQGIPIPRELNPKRPLASEARYRRTLGAMRQLAAAAPTDQERDRWIRVECALFLAKTTSRRLGSIRQLR